MADNNTINAQLLDIAIEQLKSLDLRNSESVQINNTKFDDGSMLFEVGISFPAKWINVRVSNEAGMLRPPFRIRRKPIKLYGGRFYDED